MTLLTPEERAQLEPALARSRQREEYREHEAARRAGLRPDVALAVYQRGRAAAVAGDVEARRLIALALAPGTPAPARHDAARAAVAALPAQLAAYASTSSPKRFARRVSQSVVEVARALAVAYEGPRGPRAARGTASAYVQQEDLDDLLPDGWGSSWPLEASRLGRRAGVAPLAVPLLCLLTWCHALRPPADATRSGAGLQCSVEWLARKLGCSRTWVKVLLNRLDPAAAWRRELAAVRRANARRRRRGAELLAEPPSPTGTSLLHRYRRLKRLADLPQVDGKRRTAWVDRAGRPHFWVDVRGVCYSSEFGRRVLVRRAELLERPRPGHRLRLRPIGFLNDATARLEAVAWRLRARLGDPAEFESEHFGFPGAPAG